MIVDIYCRRAWLHVELPGRQSSVSDMPLRDFMTWLNEMRRPTSGVSRHKMAQTVRLLFFACLLLHCLSGEFLYPVL